MYQVHGTGVHGAYLSAAPDDARCAVQAPRAWNCNKPCKSLASRRLITRFSPEGVQPAGRVPTWKKVCNAGNRRSRGW